MNIAEITKKFGITPEQAGEAIKMALANDNAKNAVTEIAKKFGMEQKQAQELYDGARGAVDGGLLNGLFK